MSFPIAGRRRLRWSAMTGYPDVALDMIDNRTFDGRILLVEYRPRVLEYPPLGPTA